MKKEKFSDNLNTAVFTSKYVLGNNSPILYIYHYEDDGAWAFLGIETLNEEDYRIISLDEAINIDPSILEIASMPLGYYAKRESRAGKWIIDKI